MFREVEEVEGVEVGGGVFREVRGKKTFFIRPKVN